MATYSKLATADRKIHVYKKLLTTASRRCNLWDSETETTSTESSAQPVALTTRTITCSADSTSESMVEVGDVGVKLLNIFYISMMVRVIELGFHIYYR